MRRVAGVCLLVVLWWTVVLPVAAQSPPTVTAASAVLYEPVSGTVLFERDAYTPRAMASTTKLMTALLAAECGDWERPVEVTAEMVAVEGSALGLRGGDRLTLRDAVSGMLLTSGNDAANAVAVTVSGSLSAFVERMNEKAAALGMTDSGFATPSGLADDTEGDKGGDDGLDNEIVTVDLSKVNPQIDQIFFFLNIYSPKNIDFQKIPYVAIRMYEGTPQKVQSVFAQYDVAKESQFMGADALIMGKLYRRNGDWKFAAIGDAFKDNNDLRNTIKRIVNNYSK